MNPARPKEAALWPAKFFETIGAYIGDGFLSTAGQGPLLGFSGNLDEELPYYCAVIIPAMLLVFPDVNPTVAKRPDHTSFEVRFRSQQIVDSFERWFGFLPGRKTETVRIPEWIVHSSMLNFVVRGIFDTDGCAFFDRRKRYKRPYPRISNSLKNKGLVDQLASALSEFSLYRWYRPGKEASCLEIYGHRQLEKWMKTIGFSNPRHLRRLKEASIAQPVERHIGNVEVPRSNRGRGFF